MRIEQKWRTTEATKDNWETPSEFFQAVNLVYNFNIDAAASSANKKCEEYLANGLSAPWVPQMEHIFSSAKDMRFWCNPPYGRDIGKWIDRAEEACKAGALVVMLLPARTDTKWFHEHFVYPGEFPFTGHAFYAVQFLKGRLCFELGGQPIRDEKGRKAPALFPSMLAVMRPKT